MIKPKRPFFSSGPCGKFLGWNGKTLEKRALLGRSHRSEEGIERVHLLLKKSRELLEIPEDYLIALVPGSDTGAFEMALWNLLGSRPVDLLSWDVFGDQWAQDLRQLPLEKVHFYQSSYGDLPTIESINPDHDLVFTWNGTTTGIWFPHGDWIATDRKGLTLCDATSAVLATPLPWEKLDVTTYSWQKVLGGEAAHGMIILSPRVQERLNTYIPSWPIPKILDIRFPGIFEGVTINTPSLLCIEDCLMALEWAERSGGSKGLIQRTRSNFAAAKQWVEQSTWATWLCPNLEWQAHTSLCLTFKEERMKELSQEERWKKIQQLVGLMKEEKVAYDISNHKKSVPALRIWAGPTIEKEDIEQLLPWLDWGYKKLFSS